ncbi:hypothetical protein EV421DRAFT_1735376 [Armillaria borealis]|uniref:Phytanoyl-CoA dioxygenase n=1 Tax=Armillaria borealis TaxID=47425 RepID=A0AA39JLU2_9AGAR|nr:hypothetical protein EV421DRAFT_1735376 [Armillaria borealis]
MQCLTNLSSSQPSSAERAGGKYSKDSLRRAIEGLNRDGVIYLDNIVDPAHVEKLRLAMLDEAKILKAKKGNDVSQYNQGVATNFIQSPPLTNQSLFFEDVYANPFVHQVVSYYLGPFPSWTFITGNNANKQTTDRQAVHKDSPFIHPLAPSIIIANFPLCEFSPENGSTEMWLGSHATTDPGDQMKVRPPIQIACKPGGVMLRDQRIWHAGMPNASKEDRIMLAMMFMAAWFPNDRKFKLPYFAKEILEFKPLAVNVQAEYVSEAECEESLHQWGSGIQPSDPNYRSLWEVAQLKNSLKV